MRVLDVSHHQHHLKATDLAGIDAVWAKATEGSGFRDQVYRQHLATAHQAGVPIGAYHFAHPDQSAAAQLGNWTTVVHTQGYGQLPPMLDVEDDAKRGLFWRPAHRRLLLDLLEGLERTTGRTPLLYTNGPTAIGAGLKDDSRFARYPLWLARYPSGWPDPDPAKLTHPPAPGPWSRWTLWQFTSQGTAGHVHPVDLSIPGDTFAAILHPGHPAPHPAPHPVPSIPGATVNDVARIIASLTRIEAEQKRQATELAKLAATVQKDLEVDLVDTDERRHQAGGA